MVCRTSWRPPAPLSDRLVRHLSLEVESTAAKYCADSRPKAAKTEDCPMRRLPLLTLVIGLGLTVAACASPVSAPGEPSDEAPSTPAAQSEAPVESESPAESQPAASEGGEGSTGEAPALADGPWTGGQGQITVGGGVSLTVDEPITLDLSKTEDAKTLLAYNSDREFVTIFINFIGVPFHASVDGDDFSASSEDCEVTYSRADDTGIDATFSCVADEFYWYSVDEEPTGDITLEGSFTATR